MGTRNGSRTPGVTTVHNVIAYDSAGNPRTCRFEIGAPAVHLTRGPPPRSERSGRLMAQSVKDRTTGQTAKERTMAQTLPPLPYDFGALEPYIDAQTMQIHHGKHHQAYVNNLTAALDKHPELHKKTLEDLLRGINGIPEDIRAAVRNNGGGPHNHPLFWTIKAPARKGGGRGAGGPLADAIKKAFGDLAKFK